MFRKEEGLEVYLVGGAVRDRLLQRPVVERDYVVVGSTPEEMIRRGFKPVGQEFPVFLHPDTQEEYALARMERKIAKGYHGFTCVSDPTVTLEQDLSRRDLTINAMAEDPNGRIIDPFGGQADLQARVLRHVSSAFVEDPVRILRLARFSARFYPLGFQVAEETGLLMKEMVRLGEVDALTSERVWKEWSRALLEANPDVFFDVLADVGALPILFPEAKARMERGWIKAMPLDLPVRFAMGLFVLGYRDKAQVEAIANRYKCPSACRDLAVLWAEYRDPLENGLSLDAETRLRVLEKTDAFRRPARFEQLLYLCRDEPTRVDWTKKRQMAHAVSVQPFLSAGLTGLALKQALQQARLQALKAD